MLVCAKCAILGTRDRGCSVHPAPPRPLFGEGQRICKTRLNHAARSRTLTRSPRRPAKAGTHTPRRKLFENGGDGFAKAIAPCDYGSRPPVRNCALGRDDVKRERGVAASRGRSLSPPSCPTDRSPSHRRSAPVQSRSGSAPPSSAVGRRGCGTPRGRAFPCGRNRTRLRPACRPCRCRAATG